MHWLAGAFCLTRTAVKRKSGKCWRLTQDIEACVPGASTWTGQRLAVTMSGDSKSMLQHMGSWVVVYNTSTEEYRAWAAWLLDGCLALKPGTTKQTCNFRPLMRSHWWDHARTLVTPDDASYGYKNMSLLGLLSQPWRKPEHHGQNVIGIYTLFLASIREPCNLCVHALATWANSNVYCHKSQFRYRARMWSWMHTCLENGFSSWVQLVSIGTAQMFLQLFLVISFNSLEMTSMNQCMPWAGRGWAHVGECACGVSMWECGVSMWECGVVCVRACMHVGAHVCHLYVQVCHSPEPCPAPVVPAVYSSEDTFFLWYSICIKRSFWYCLLDCRHNTSGHSYALGYTR